jgi:hypothetical protein
MLNLLRNSINAIRSISGLDSDASAFITAAGLTDPTQKSAINTLVKDMKAAGLWTKMKAVYPMVGGTATSMKFNLKDPRDLDAAFRLTWSGGWTYSATGATPNGTNAYADTKLVPSTSLSTSSAHFSKYNRTNDLVGNKVDGSIGGTSTFFFQQNYSAGNGIIGEVGSIMSYTPTDTRGLFTSTRTSTSLAKQFRNSSQVSSATTTITGMSDRSIFIGARNDATITFYNSYQAAFASIGYGLSDAEAALLYQLVQQFQTDLSRQV